MDPSPNTQPITLREAFKIALTPPSNLGYWLYIADKYPERHLESPCFFFDPNNDDEDEVVVLHGRSFTPSLDIDTIADCVKWADRLAGNPDDSARFDIFTYYCRFDAFPQKLGADDPPPWEESQRKLDLEWYDKLGPEDSRTRCKRDGCTRGTVQFSAFCRPHHFEMIRKQPCPFVH
jgi:hypothetical protein